jgi:hypothetical protein
MEETFYHSDVITRNFMVHGFLTSWWLFRWCRQKVNMFVNMARYLSISWVRSIKSSHLPNIYFKLILLTFAHSFSNWQFLSDVYIKMLHAVLSLPCMLHMRTISSFLYLLGTLFARSFLCCSHVRWKRFATLLVVCGLNSRPCWGRGPRMLTSFHMEDHVWPFARSTFASSTLTRAVLVQWRIFVSRDRYRVK